MRALTTLAMALIMTSAATAAGKGTSGGQFLRVGVGARGPAMGGAFGPVTDDATAIYWNPAGLSLVEKRNLEISYNAYFEDTSSQFVGYAHPTENRGTFGAGITLLGVSDIDKRSVTGGDADTPDLGTFATRDMALSVGWGNKLEMFGGRTGYGVALKYVSSDLETESAATAALDMGLHHHFNPDMTGFSLSLAVLNLGGELKFEDEGDPLPLNIKPGLAWKRNFNSMGKLTLALDSDILVNDGIAYVSPGFEWWINQMFALRSGYQIGRDDEAGSGFAAGVGFRMGSVGLDYGFVPYGDLGDTHRLSLSLKF